MKIIPVLDILHGIVVRGIAGRRDDYRPLVSQLTARTEPVAVAQSIREALGLTEFYVADLDGILHQRPNLPIYQSLLNQGFQLLVDAGIRNANDVDLLLESGLNHLIVGLESCASPRDLLQIVERNVEVTFSLDLSAGVPRRSADSSGWDNDPIEIAHQAIASGVTSMLPLDLADVGTGTGGSTDAICRFLRTTYPEIRIIAGGGVRNREDLIRLQQLEIDAVLVASAFHDGRVSRGDLASLH